MLALKWDIVLFKLQVLGICFSSWKATLINKLKINEQITENPKEDHITVDFKEIAITEYPKEDPLLINLKSILSLKTLSLKTLRNFRTFNDCCTTKNSFLLFGDGV